MCARSSLSIISPLASYNGIGSKTVTPCRSYNVSCTEECDRQNFQKITSAGGSHSPPPPGAGKQPLEVIKAMWLFLPPVRLFCVYCSTTDWLHKHGDSMDSRIKNAKNVWNKMNLRVLYLSFQLRAVGLPKLLDVFIISLLIVHWKMSDF